jgi:hypothetical protein
MWCAFVALSLSAPARAAGDAPLHPVFQVQGEDSNAAFSADGRTLMTFGTGHHVWSVETRSIARTFEGQGFAGAISPKSDLALFSTGRAFDLATGATLFTLPTHGTPLLSPDGKTAVFVAPKPEDPSAPCIEVWDLEKKTRVRTMMNGPCHPTRAALSANGAAVLAMRGDGTNRIEPEVWDVASGTLRSALPFVKAAADTHTGIQSMSLSPSGNRVVACITRASKTTLAVADTKTGAVVAELPDDSSPRGAVMTSDDEVLSASDAVRVWDVPSRRVTKTMLPGKWTSIAASPDGKTLALGAMVGATTRTLVLASRASERELGKLGHPRGMGALSPWTVASDGIPRGGVTLDGRFAYVPVGRFGEHRLLEWDTEALAVRRELMERDLKPATWRALTGFGTHDGVLFARKSGVETVEICDGATGAVRSRIALPSGQDARFLFTDTGGLLVGTSTMVGAPDIPFALYDPRTGTKSATFDGGSFTVAASGDGKVIAAMAMPFNSWEGGMLSIYDAATGVVKKKLPKMFMVDALNADGTRALVFNSRGETAYVDTDTGRELWAVPPLNAFASRILPDGKTAVSVGFDGVVRRTRLDTGEWVAMLATSADDWVVAGSDGTFDASRRGGELVALVSGITAFPVDQLAVRYNRPDLLLTRMGIGTPDLIAHYKARYDARLRALGLKETDVAGLAGKAPRVEISDLQVNGSTANLTFVASSVGAPLRGYSVLVNGVPVATGDVTSASPARLSSSVVLLPGDNHVEVVASDVAGAESLHAFRDVTVPGASRGELYFLGIGVSRYKDARLALAYAAKDVGDLAAVLAREKGKAFDDVHVKTLTDADATSAALAGAKSFFAAAKSSDTAVVLVAGHGTRSNAATADYYFVTHDTNLADVPSTAAPFSAVEGLLDGVAARKKLLLLDTCESGERDDDAVRTTTNAKARGIRSRALVLETAPAATSAPRQPRKNVLDRERYIYRDISRRTGALVLASSRGSESSYEFDELSNGAFTWALRDALTTDKADTNHDKSVSAEELRVYVASAVATVTGDAQHPTLDIDNPWSDIVFATVSPPAPSTESAPPQQKAESSDKPRQSSADVAASRRRRDAAATSSAGGTAPVAPDVTAALRCSFRWCSRGASARALVARDGARGARKSSQLPQTGDAGSSNTRARAPSDSWQNRGHS